MADLAEAKGELVYWYGSILVWNTGLLINSNNKAIFHLMLVYLSKFIFIFGSSSPGRHKFQTKDGRCVGSREVPGHGALLRHP